MTVGVDDELRVREYPGDDSANARAVPFYFLDNDDLKVTRIDADGSETVLVRGTHYSVAGAGNPTGGSVTPLAPIATGTSWRIEGDISLGQPTDYTGGDDFPAESHERGLDRSMIAHQEARRDLLDLYVRALLLPRGETAPAIPDPLTRASRFLGFDAAGNVIFSFGTGADAGLREDMADPDIGGSLLAYAAGLTFKQMLDIQQVSVRRHGAVGDLNLGTGAGTDDTAAIQAAIDAVAAEGGGFVYFERGKAYKVTADIIVKENVRVDLNGATVAGYFNGGNASTFRLRSWSALFGGTVLVRSSGLPGISAPAHCPVTAGCRYGDANSVAAPNADHDPQHFEIFNLTVESDKWVDDGAGKFLGAPGIQIIGGAHYRVENIRVPASAVMYGAVHVDWGYIGTLSTADTAVAQNANKTAYNAGDAWLVPSRHGTIRNIRAGALTAPSTATDRGSFCVRLSGVHDIIVEDCEAESVTYQAYVHEVGDLGAEFVPAAERHKLARGVRFRNCRVRSTTGQVFELKSYADNVDRAILDGYVAMADPLVECDVIFDGGGGVGPGAGATTPGVRVIQTRGGELRNVELSGFKDGILVDEKVFGTRLTRCHVHGNEQEGVRVHHATFPPEDIVVEDVWAYENGQDAAYGDPAVGVHLGTSKRCKIVRGRFGKSGVANDPTQDFGWRIADGAVEATVEMPEVLSYKVGGGDAFIQRSDLILAARKERRGPGAPFYASGVATAAVTGTTDETAFGPTITVPGGMLGKNGMIEIEVLASSTGAAGNKIVNVYLGATRMHAVVIAAGDGVARASVRIFNRNDEASQVSMLAGSGGWASNGSGVATAAIDTTADADITFKADLDVGTDSVRIEALIVRVEPKS